jgi:hypothetical protein
MVYKIIVETTLKHSFEIPTLQYFFFKKKFKTMQVSLHKFE